MQAEKEKKSEKYVYRISIYKHYKHAYLPVT